MGATFGVWWKAGAGACDWAGLQSPAYQGLVLKHTLWLALDVELWRY